MYIHMLNEDLKQRYGCKVYKLSLSSGCGCPNRDSMGKHGCIFCDGAGTFATKGSIEEQLTEAKQRVAQKVKGEVKYIAYFQSFTNTFAPVSVLEPLFLKAMEPQDVVALSIATRPDCLPPDILDMLSRLQKIKPVWVELGLQTIHESTAKWMRRGYPLSTFQKAVKDLKDRNIEVIVHQILGFPNETPKQMAETSRYIGESGADGIKLHLLHVLKNTDLEPLFLAGKVPPMTMEEYISALEICISYLPKTMVIHRLTGDGAKKDLLSPLWSADKKRVLNAIHKAFLEDDVIQGSRLT